MRSTDQNKLLHEVLTGSEVADFRRASLENGLAAIRATHRWRKATRVAAVLSMALLFPGALLLIQRSGGSQPPKAVELSRNDVPAAAQQKTKFINDEELFSLFPGEPVALIGKPGEQQLVFLRSPEFSDVQ
jgi:hypothetical protein